jgi:putative membrane protein
MWKKFSTFLVLSFFSVTQVLQAVAQQSQPSTVPPQPQWYGPGPWHMWNDGYGWHFWWMGPMMMLFMLLICVAVLYFLFAHRPWSAGMHHGGPSGHMIDRMWRPPTDSAIQILNERFARGEIQKDEYEDKKAAILSGVQR